MKNNKITNAQEYIDKFPKWEEQLRTAREILNSFPLVETIKWGAPCYTYNGTNLIGLAGFKNHCAIWFHKGSLLQDKQEVFENAQPDKTKFLRQLRFRESENINTSLLKEYIAEALQIEETAVPPNTKSKSKTKKEFELAPELKDVCETDEKLFQAFQKLSNYNQREYSDYIKEAKRESTKERRIIKIKSLIMEGKSLHDKYKK
ncbi:uncharacterized protein YdeI (YjbR/CyaY-like superfamily) [Nonlabens dokdonensis]|uniref:DUF1801 domain containing protein n=2 Tax=Nonlabens dokdonensis TaxID=328515 RepID=L7W5Z1_NONDD|nr:DUF1801 domain-containing protein [Nonlabens dokdonensis]AGC75529.1 DUF1801 domain containing protein [Nonlabens dokdonensis DSW-6]PZX43224.1 uncharacterized protein YdeI (YjbR/CyaY-like superfamily) [Nonlabens dokdonensis]